MNRSPLGLVRTTRPHPTFRPAAVPASSRRGPDAPAPICNERNAVTPSISPAPDYDIEVWADAVVDAHVAQAEARDQEEGKSPGRGLIFTAAGLLGTLAIALYAVSLSGQYHYILNAKHESWASWIEAGALDVGMVVFALLALGLSMAGQKSATERGWSMMCAIGSAGMNYAAADVSSIRSVAAYVVPPIFLAIVADRVIAVIRKHVLGLEAEKSGWATIGRWLLAVPVVLARAVLYLLRLVLAPASTVTGARRWVLASTPLPAPAQAVVLTATPDVDEGLAELEVPDRKALPGTCAANKDGAACGRPHPCEHHDPYALAHIKETKREHLIRLYKAHEHYGDRNWASRVASELAPYASLSSLGTARNYINEHLDQIEKEAA